MDAPATMYGIVANYETGFGYTSLWAVGMHDLIQRIEFMNAPKLNPLKHDWPKFTKSVTNRT